MRSTCPAVGVPDYTGDITLFSNPGATTADSIDVVGALTNVRSTCNESGEKVFTSASFDVLARRTDTRGARQVTLPYFVTVLRGGNAVISKRVGTVTINFADGQERARYRRDHFLGAVADDDQRRIDADRGFDPLADGFFWFAGQGGFGIQTAPAAAELALGLLLGRTGGSVDPQPYDPKRFH